ncbi:MAG: glycosyltransferase family 1 protein [Lachnospiraceae bacterium]|nr:glycosyltransferase family 1 protein [Lachnospiraceae bacterium]
MKRVLQVLGSLQRGGAEAMIMNIYRVIDKNRVQFDFLVKERVENGFEEEVIALGGRIFCVPSPKKIGIYKYIKNQIAVMKENGPYEAVHSHVNYDSGISLLSAAIAGIKRRISHSHNTEFPESINVKIGKALIGIVATERLACGKEAGVALFGKRKFIVFPNAIDTSKYLPVSDEKEREIARELQIDKNTFNICHVGRFNVQKNHVFLIDVIAAFAEKTSDFKLYLLGEGELRITIEELVREKHLQDKIVFCGSVDNVSDYLHVVDCFVLPSNFEGLPVSLVEAQCAGLQCLVSEHITTEVDFKVGLLKYIPLDVNRWEEALYEVQRRNENSKEHGQLQVILERNYDIYRSVDSIYQYYGV